MNATTPGGHQGSDDATNRQTKATRFLLPVHRRELEEESAISTEVVAERGYETINRPSASDPQIVRNRLRRLAIPTWATSEDADFPGLLIPLYGPTGQLVSYQWKPRRPVRNRDGKPMKYASQRGQASRLDVHPRNTAAVADPTVPLWITEGVKKADALTSQGACAVALAGVFNWRSTLGTLGDWEDVALRGRHVVVCFDHDATTNPNVQRAMFRLGRWLKSKGVKKTTYVVVPAEVNGTGVKGADDWFAAGGTLGDLLAAGSSTPPVEVTDDTYSDARLAETIAEEMLADRFVYSAALGWLAWDGRRWVECSDGAPLEAVRQFSLDRFGEVLEEVRTGSESAGSAAFKGWQSMLSAGRERTVLGLARGIVEVDAREFDSDPDLLNTPSGVVDLTTGELMPHSPDLLFRKLAGAAYVPGATHPDWDKALEALPEDVRGWYQLRVGQAITGHMTPDDVLIVAEGGGENGKSTVAEATSRAAGDYFLLLSDRVLLANPGDHPTELMDLMGVRYAVAEETPEARRLDVNRLKKSVGTSRIKARHIRKDSVEFDATHSLFINTNYLPLVEETDHGTWRRLARLRFPYRFRKPHEELVGENDRRGDPTLRDRVRTDPAVRAAALAWMVEGARHWYELDRIMPEPPARVVADTREWRADSDLVLSYIADRLEFHPDSHVMATDLLADLNRWLADRGHHKWSDKTMASRLGRHDEVTGHGVKKQQVRRNESLSRPGWQAPVNSQFTGGESWTTVPARYAAWLGLAFQKD